MGSEQFRKLVVLGSILLPGVVQAQVQLRGRLVSAAGEPIPGATVLLKSVGYSVRADSLGRFVLSGQAGATLVLAFTAPNFRRDSATIVLPRGRSIERDFTMTSAEAAEPESNLSATMVRGRVLDESGAPLSYANVQANYGRRYLADDSGRFQLPYPGTGSSTLYVRRIGFEPVELNLAARPDTALRVILTAIPTQLKEVTVTTAGAYRSLDLHGFYGRMRDAERGATNGHFITPEDIERRKATNTTQMADGFANIRVYKSGLGPMWDRIMGPGNCEMTVYLTPFEKRTVRCGSHLVQMTRIHPLLVVLATSLPGASQAQVELYGRVISRTGDPIPGASIMLTSIGYSVRSDTMAFSQSGCTTERFSDPWAAR